MKFPDVLHNKHNILIKDLKEKDMAYYIYIFWDNENNEKMTRCMQIKYLY